MKKNTHSPRAPFGVIPSLAFLSLLGSAHAQLSWDPTISSGVSLGGAGTWDTTTANWWNGASNVIWDNDGSETANIVDTGSNQIVSLDSDLMIGDLSYAGGDILQFRGSVDNQVVLIAEGGATWNTGGGEVEFLASTAELDIQLVLTSGSTLTIDGGGTFDTGERPNDATWIAEGAILDVTSATILRGNGGTVGQFDTVKLLDGSTYNHERNADQTYLNGWDITGTVNLDNRYAGRSLYLNGLVEGTGGLNVTINTNNGGAGPVRLNNPSNSFSGGVVVDGTANYSQLQVYGGDGSLGEIPAAFDAENVRLISDADSGGALELNGITMDVNRGITLEGGGILLASGTNTINGGITGTGDLQLGVDQDGNGGFMILAGVCDYDGETNIRRGNLTLGADNVLPPATLVRVGGNGASRLIVNGKTQTIAGLGTAGSNTRQVINSTSAGPIAGTLTLNVPEGIERIYGSAFGVNETNQNGELNIVKTGEGRQQLGNVRISGSVLVTEGELEIGNSGGIASIASATVTAGVLALTDDLTIADGITVGDGGSLEVLVNETNSTLEVTDAIFGPSGAVALTLDYATLTLGNPSYPGIDVLGTDGFEPTSTSITINVDGSGFEVGQFELIKYDNSSPLADINNFALGSLPAGVAAVLVNNTANQSIDLNITEAVQSLVWSGDTTIDGIGDWDIGSALTWNTNSDSYTDSYPAFGAIGDNVTFSNAVTDIDAGVAGVNLTTDLKPSSITVNNTAGTVDYVFSGSGKITGSTSLTKTGNGDLTISNAGNDYTGGTIIDSGDLILGANDALPTAGLLSVGGSGTSRLLMNGFDQTVGGLAFLGNNTRQILNTIDAGVPVGTPPTLTINVPALEEYNAGFAIGLNAATDQGNLNVTMGGEGRQLMGQLQISGELSVTGGTLVVGNAAIIAKAGDASTSTGGDLAVTGWGLDLDSLTVNSGGKASIIWNVTDWTGAVGPGVDWPRINTSGDFTVSDDNSFTVVIDDEAITGFTEADTSFTIGSVGGTMGATSAKFAVVQTGFSAGVGTFTVGVVGQDIVLSYTAGSASAYDTWAAGFPGLTGGFDDDDDLDGLSNGEEWYFGGTNPLIAGDGSPLANITSAGSGTFTFTHLRPTDTAGATASYEWSSSLQGAFTANGASDGSYTVSLTPGAATPDITGYESVTVTVSSTPVAPKVFARVRLSMP